MLHKIALVEVTAIVDVEPAHLAIGHFDASHLHRDHSCAHFESEITNYFSAHCTHNRNFVTNGFHILVFVGDWLSRALPAGLKTGLPRPKHDHVVAHIHEGM